MPRRTDISKILIIGSGPIVIGQACEFDYSGTQAVKALREEGYKVVLINSNPATIMTDPELADRTYIEPITPEAVEKVIEIERPDALLPTMGGQTALNIAIELDRRQALQKYGVELIGAKPDAIHRAENRDMFKHTMQDCGLKVPASGMATSAAEAWKIVEEIGYPVIIRPSYTLGGTGGNVAYNKEEFDRHIRWGMSLSWDNSILIEESVIGWKEFELEVMRDLADNVVIICSIENLDPMGIHTGDSITIAPAQTLTDKEYQILRDASIKIIRAIGVETGGSNIQFAVHPDTGEMVVIEMNPRVSRSSALASKATGFPIAKMAAKLAVGYTLDEIPNDITKKTPACFEPVIDYCVVKYPRFAFDKFAGADSRLTTQMKSVGEAMAIGRTFREALMKAIRSLEIDRYDLMQKGDAKPHRHEIEKKLRTPSWDRLFFVAEAFRSGFSIDEVHRMTTRIDPWFLEEIRDIVRLEDELKAAGKDVLENIGLITEAKRWGISDVFLAKVAGLPEAEWRKARVKNGVACVYKTVDTCAAEFESYTPYLYSTYESESEENRTQRRKIVILGGGPNRIGQGIEFDYCCVHAAFALKEDGFETIMVNCNPETVSTDYDTSDKLYFEPLTFEDVMNIVEAERPEGVIVQFGGQTPLKLAKPLEEAGVRILGTSPDSIDRAEDRERFRALLQKLGLKQADNDIATNLEEALDAARRIGYPLVIRPSFVLGGQRMKIVHDEEDLNEYMRDAVEVSHSRPVLVDKFLEDAQEIDVDAVADGRICVIGGIMEHIEEAGVHSGDSACSIPPFSLSPDIIAEISRQTKALAMELDVRGLINIQFAVQGKNIFVLEVNPRASRTVPFVSKAIGKPIAKIAARVMAGKTLEELGFTNEIVVKHISVKEAVFPFSKFPGVDTVLGPEMKSTGEVMGISGDFGQSFAKSQIAAGNALPLSGTVFISVRDHDKNIAARIARDLHRLGFKIVATRGTAAALNAVNISVEMVNKVKEGQPNIVDKIINGEIDLVINTTIGKKAVKDSYTIRRTALERGIPYFTTVQGALAATRAIEALQGEKTPPVKSLQDYYLDMKSPSGR